MKASGFFFLLLFFLFQFTPVLASPSRPSPLWDSPIKLCDSSGKVDQENPIVAADPFGGYLTVFEDRRSGNTRLYAQRIGENGEPLWEKDGLPVADSVGSQTNPQLIISEDNSAIVAWQEEYNGNLNIYAQKIDFNGVKYWGERGILLAVSEKIQSDPVIATDGAGGMIAAWQDLRHDNEDVFVQRFDPNGKALWQDNGIALTTNPKTQAYPRIAADGRGGAIVAWSDRRSGNSNLRLQHLSAGGKILWDDEGKTVASSQKSEEDPQILVLSGGKIVVPYRIKNEGVYAVFLDGNGGIISTQMVSQNDGAPFAAGIGKNNEALIFWSGSSRGDSDLYLSAFGEKGNLLWNRPLVEVRGRQEHPALNGSGPWLATWIDHRSGRPEIFCQKIDLNGNPLFAENGIKICGGQKEPSSFSSALNVVVFQDKREGGSDIFGQKLGPLGELLWGETGTILNAARGKAAQRNATVINDGFNNYIAAFEDHRSGFSKIYLQKISPDGLLLWGKSGVAAADSNAPQKAAVIAADGLGGVFAAWEDSRDSAGSKIFTQHIFVNGKKASPNGIAASIKNSAAEQVNPKLVPPLIVWENYEGAYNSKDLRAQRLNQKGKPLWQNENKLISYGGDQLSPALSNKLVVAWADSRLDGKTHDIYAQKITPSGQKLWTEDGVTVCEAPDVQIDPLAADWGEDCLIAWTDKAGGSFDIYAQKVDANGIGRWVKDGIAVAQSSRTQQRAVASFNDLSNPVLVWEDFRFGNWDIYAQSLDVNGKTLWQADGLPIVSASATQYNPKIVRARGGNLIAWEDYRSENRYSIYLQKINNRGGIDYPENGALLGASKSGGRFPQLAAGNDKSSAIVLWEDHSLTEPQILAQRFRL